MGANRKNAVWNFIGTSANAFVSLFFLTITTRVNGLEQAGVYSLHFATACILFVLGNYVNRVFQVTDVHNEYGLSDYFWHRMLSFSAVMVTALCIALAGGAGSRGDVLVLLCAYRGLDAVGEFYYGIYQKAGKLYLTGYSMTMKAALSVLAFYTADQMTGSLPMACSAAVAVNLGCVLTFDAYYARSLGLAIQNAAAGRLWRLTCCCFSPFLLALLNIYFANAPKYAASTAVSLSEQGVLSMILMPGTFMTLLGSIAMMQRMQSVGLALEQGAYGQIKRILGRLTLALAAVSTLICIIAYFLEAPVLGWVFATELSPYRFPMLLVLVGSVFYSLQYIYFYFCVALRKTGHVVITYLICSGAILALQRSVAASGGLMGVCLLYACAMLLLAVSLGIITACVLGRLTKEAGEE